MQSIQHLEPAFATHELQKSPVTMHSSLFMYLYMNVSQYSAVHSTCDEHAKVQGYGQLTITHVIPPAVPKILISYFMTISFLTGAIANIHTESLVSKVFCHH